MPRPLHRFAIAVLSLSLPLAAMAQQPMPVDRAGRPAAEPGRGGGDDGRHAIPERNSRGTESRALEARLERRRSMSEAIRHVQRTTGGQILGAEQVPFEGRSITRIKYMDDRGRVRYMDGPGSSERMRPEPRRDDNGEP